MNTSEKPTLPKSKHPASRARRRGTLVTQGKNPRSNLLQDKGESAIVAEPTTQSPVFAENQNFNSKHRS